MGKVIDAADRFKIKLFDKPSTRTIAFWGLYATLCRESIIAFYRNNKRYPTDKEYHPMKLAACKKAEANADNDYLV